MKHINPYEVLGVARDATAAEVRKAYRRAAKTAHPDAGGSTEAMAEISTALAVLTDPKRREHFDRTGKIDETKPDNDRQAALGIIQAQITGLMGAFVANGFNPAIDPRKMDLIQLIAAQMDAEIQQATTNINTGRRHREFAVDMIRRIKLRNPEGHEDLISRGLELLIDRIDAELLTVETAIKIRRLVKEMLLEYEFERDPTPATPQMWVGTATNVFR